ncbi:MAG: PAS domain S-box protein [Methanomicrobiaceae archaeon]|nr:PAS domain S-box protein [Methanomicrobiaceae archaeon]
MVNISEDDQTIRRLTNAIRGHPGGISISKLARETGINRNSVAKYLEILFATGQVEMKTVGAAKVFCHAKKVPLVHIADNFPDSIIVVDDAGKVLLANQACNAFFGLSPGEMAGRSLHEARLSGMPGTFFEAVRAATAGACIDDEFVVNRDGETAYLRGRFVPVALGTGKDGQIIFLEDITGEYRSRILLEESERRFRTLFDNSCAMIFVHEISKEGVPGPIFEANTFACEKLGFSREELLSLTVTDLLRAPPRITEGSTALDDLGGGECLRMEGGLFDKSGTNIPVEIYSHLISLDGRTLVLSIVLDRTYKVKYKDKILENHKNLEFLSQMALSFLDYPEDEDPYEFVADQLTGIIPGAIVVIDAMDERSGKWQNQVIKGLEQYDPLLQKFLGNHPQGVCLIPENKAVFLRSGKLVHLDTASFLELLVDGERREFIETIAGYGYEDFYKMAFFRGDSPAGIVIICTPRESALNDPELVEAFLNQAVVALGKRSVDLSLKKANQTLMQKLVEHERQLMKYREVLNISMIESREIEKLLHNQTELTQRCLELMHIAMVTVQENGTIVAANTSACDMFERSPSALVGKNWFEDCLSGGASGHAQEIHRKVAQNSRYSGILKYPVKCGKSREKEIVWMVRGGWDFSDGRKRIFWLGEEMPGVHILELSRLG